MGIARHLYGFLPASGARFTFAEAAEVAGVAEHWPGVVGISKEPAIQHLLESVFVNARGKFCELIEAIVRGAIGYRNRKGKPITREEMAELNRLVAMVGFKIPELWDRVFLESLAAGVTPVNMSSSQPTVAGPEFRSAPFVAPLPGAASAVAPSSQSNKPTAHSNEPKIDRGLVLASLLQRFIELSKLTDRNAAGLALERLLCQLFAAFTLRPEGSFRLVGEQIDGAFQLGEAPFLLEAKWSADKIGSDQLYVFHAKVEGKSSFTRGLFLSISGFTPAAPEALTHGKQPSVVLMDGAHLFSVLNGEMALDTLLHRLVRRLGTHGEPYFPMNRLAVTEMP